jgi:hypothetical protein
MLTINFAAIGRTPHNDTPPAAKKAKHPNTRSKAVLVKDSEDDSIDELSPMKPGSKLRQELHTKPTPQSRSSLSSVSTVRDLVESSAYSTPGTSAVATPATNIVVK